MDSATQIEAYSSFLPQIAAKQLEVKASAVQKREVLEVPRAWLGLGHWLPRTHG